MDKYETITVASTVLGIVLLAGIFANGCNVYNKEVFSRSREAIRNGCSIINDNHVICPSEKK